MASTLDDVPATAAATVPGMKDRALRACGLYGANASGKTTVLRALQFMQSAVRQSHRIWEPGQRIPLELFRGSNSGRSEFVVDLTFQDVRYRYGFVATLERIEEEWLFSYPSGRKQVWFSRKESGITFGRHLPGDNKTIAGLTRNNSLFLSASAQNNHEMLLPIYKWFTSGIAFVFEERKALGHRTARMCAMEESRAAIAQFLSVADLGVVDLQYSLEEADPEAEEKLNRAFEALSKVFGFKLPTEEEVGQRSSIKLVHKIGTELIPFNFGDESDGTVAYVSLLGPIVRSLKQGSVLVVDELDSSLHPLMARHIIQLFNSERTNPRSAQLIFNTHDTNLLARGLLRRDQIWFTEKDGAGVSHLYPLTDFRPRQDENLRNGYLQGRYGAIPFITSDAVLTDAT